jgi:small-conductance mechanosensitive channel
LGKVARIAGLIIGGLVMAFLGYSLTIMAYRPGGGPYTYFYPVRYYGGIIIIIVGAFFFIVGIIAIFLSGPKTTYEFSETNLVV